MSVKIKKILLAIRDVSAKKAIARAATIARKADAQIELFSAVRPASTLLRSKAHALQVSRAQVEERLARLETLAQDLRDEGLTVSCKVELDYAGAEAILRRVQVAKPDLVIIEAHKHALLSRLLLSQTDFELIRNCAAPLLIIKAVAVSARPAVLAALDPWHSSGKPAALDARIADVGHAISRALGGKLHAVHVHAPLMRYETDSIMAPVVVPVPVGEQKKHTAAVRQRFRSMARKFEIAPQNVHLRLGDPGMVLPELARSLKVDTLVLGAVSRSALTRVLIGNTAERVLDATPCNLLIVKPKGFRPAKR